MFIVVVEIVHSIKEQGDKSIQSDVHELKHQHNKMFTICHMCYMTNI